MPSAWLPTNAALTYQANWRATGSAQRTIPCSARPFMDVWRQTVRMRGMSPVSRVVQLSTSNRSAVGHVESYRECIADGFNHRNIDLEVGHSNKPFAQ